MATSPLPSRGPTSGRKCDVTRVFSGVPIKGDKIRSGYLTPAFSRAYEWAEVLCNPGVLGVSIKGDKIRKGYLTPAFSGAHMRAEVLCNPCVLGVHIKGDKNGQSRANGKMP